MTTLTATTKVRERRLGALDRRAAERYAEQGARDAIAARAAASGPRLGSVEATNLMPGSPLAGDLLPAALTSLFGTWGPAHR